MPKKDYDYFFKMLIIGDYGVGKMDFLQSIMKTWDTTIGAKSRTALFIYDSILPIQCYCF